jgi:hypothetical protein
MLLCTTCSSAGTASERARALERVAEQIPEHEPHAREAVAIHVRVDQFEHRRLNDQREPPPHVALERAQQQRPIDNLLGDRERQQAQDRPADPQRAEIIDEDRHPPRAALPVKRRIPNDRPGRAALHDDEPRHDHAPGVAPSLRQHVDLRVGVEHDEREPGHERGEAQLNHAFERHQLRRPFRCTGEPREGGCRLVGQRPVSQTDDRKQQVPPATKGRRPRRLHHCPRPAHRHVRERSQNFSGCTSSAACA